MKNKLKHFVISQSGEGTFAPSLWKEITFTLNGTKYQAEAKVYDLPSEFGINEGRISKLGIRRITSSVQAVYHYDRGEDMAPADAEAKEALQIILDTFPS